MAAAAESINRPLLHRVSWGALFAGFFFGFAAWFLLLALGAGVGGVAFNPRALSGWQGLGLGMGIWSIIAAIIAFFFAGWLAARLSQAQERIAGLLHGVALWGFMIAVGVWMTASAVGTAVTGAASVAGNAAGGLASAAGGAAKSATQSRQGNAIGNQLTAAASGQIAGNMNQWLQQQHLPPVAPQQMQSAIGNIGQGAMSKLQSGVPPKQAFDRQTVVNGLTQAGIPPGEAQQMAGHLQQELTQATSQAGQQVQQAAGSVGSAAATAGAAIAWAFFIYAVLTLIAAAIGGALGTPGERRTPIVREERTAPLTPPSPQRA